jgi:beta-glucosidase
MPQPAFPPGFHFGAATSAYQIEGSLHADGRGESVWDRFAAMLGTIADATDGGVACDHYRRYLDDVSLLRELGVSAYRFSVAWPRILPEGRRPANPAGLDFYDALVDALLATGITPFVTLNHWDLPQALQDEGGWGSRDTVSRFAEYADAVSWRIGDRVAHWCTHNEPWCIATLGHETGEHAPGHRDPEESLRVAHHLLLSHARALPALRANAKDAQCGLVLNLVPMHPASPSAIDKEAARQADGQLNRWYLDPLFRGAYPVDAIQDRVARGHLPRGMSFVREGDMSEICAPIDWLGVNYYSRGICRGDAEGNQPRAIAEPTNRTDMGWEVYPAGLREILQRVHRDYSPKRLYVTENGAAYADGPDEDGRIHDQRRVDYLAGHLEACAAAIDSGVPLAGYFLWSLLDNYEWQFGYTKRFGAVWVDFDSQARVLKDSALWYRDFIAANSGIGARAARSA